MSRTLTYNLTKKQNHLLLDMIVFFKLPPYDITYFKLMIGFLPNSTCPHWITISGQQISEHLKGVLDSGLYGDGGRDILNGMRECYIQNRGVKGEYSFFKMIK
jgi:hypothetical protein